MLKKNQKKNQTNGFLLNAGFQQVLLVQIFWNFHNIKNQQRNVHNMFLDNNSKISLYYKNCIRRTYFRLYI